MGPDRCPSVPSLLGSPRSPPGVITARFLTTAKMGLAGIFRAINPSSCKQIRRETLVDCYYVLIPDPSRGSSSRRVASTGGSEEPVNLGLQ